MTFWKKIPFFLFIRFNFFFAIVNKIHCNFSLEFFISFFLNLKSSGTWITLAQFIWPSQYNNENFPFAVIIILFILTKTFSLFYIFIHLTRAKKRKKISSVPNKMENFNWILSNFSLKILSFFHYTLFIESLIHSVWISSLKNLRISKFNTE